MGAKTKIAGFAVLGSLVFSGVADAKSVSYGGKFAGQSGLIGGRVEFNGKGVPKSIIVSYSTLQAPCDIGDQAAPLSGSYQDESLKKKGSKYVFSGIDNGPEKGTITGAIAANGKKITGEVTDSGLQDHCTITGANFKMEPKSKQDDDSGNNEND